MHHIFLGVENQLNNFRRKFNRFCFQNRHKGIPNLMLYIALGSALVNIMAAFTGNYVLFNMLCFNRELILQGQIWRLITFVFIPESSGLEEYLVFKKITVNALCQSFA